MNLKQHFRMTASEIAMGRYMRAPDHPVADEFASTFDSLIVDDKGGAAAAGEGGDGGDGAGAGTADAAAAGAPPPPAAGTDGAAAPAGEGAAAAAPAADDKGGAPPADDKGGAAAPAATDDKGGAAKKPAKAAAGAAADDKGGAAAPAAAAPAAAEPPAGQNADEILKRLAKVVAEAPAAEAPAAAAPAATEEPAVYTEEEQKFLEEHEKEWGDMSRGEALKRRAEYRAVMSHIFSEVEKVFGPVREMVEGLATRTHVADITSAVGEYSDEEREAVIAWAKSDQHPTYLQKAFTDVIEGGTAAEVADLVGRYREATGKKPQAGAPAAEAGAPGGEVELSDAAKQAAAGLAPVDSKRSVVTQPDDPSNFDGAWERFAATERL